MKELSIFEQRVAQQNVFCILTNETDQVLHVSKNFQKYFDLPENSF